MTEELKEENQKELEAITPKSFNISYFFWAQLTRAQEERCVCQTRNFHLHYRGIKRKEKWKKKKKALKTVIFSTSLHRQMLCCWYSCQKQFIYFNASGVQWRSQTICLAKHKELLQEPFTVWQLSYVRSYILLFSFFALPPCIFISRIHLPLLQNVWDGCRKFHLIKRLEMNQEKTRNKHFFGKGGLCHNAHLLFYSWYKSI